jgi:hypothetical protein
MFIALRTSRTPNSKPQIVVYGDLDLLLGAQVAFRGLDAGVAGQELGIPGAAEQKTRLRFAIGRVGLRFGRRSGIGTSSRQTTRNGILRVAGQFEIGKTKWWS